MPRSTRTLSIEAGSARSPEFFCVRERASGRQARCRAASSRAQRSVFSYMPWSGGGFVGRREEKVAAASP